MSLDERKQTPEQGSLLHKNIENYDAGILDSWCECSRDRKLSTLQIGPHLHVYNMDGRDFVRKLVSDGVRFTQVFMNLPASAEKFLGAFSFDSL